MAERDDTDELPAVTEVIAPVPPESTPRAPSRSVEQPGVATDPEQAPVDGNIRPARFAGARRRALLWDAGYCVVSGIVLLVLWASDRPIESLPDWSTLVTGVVVVVWAGILTAIAAGGVGRTATALVGLMNLLVGGAAFGLGWFNTDVPALAVVVAAQVVGFGVVQLLASVRR